MPKALLISYAGYSESASSLMPDNGLVPLEPVQALSLETLDLLR